MNRQTLAHVCKAHINWKLACAQHREAYRHWSETLSDGGQDYYGAVVAMADQEAAAAAAYQRAFASPGGSAFESRQRDRVEQTAAQAGRRLGPCA